MINPISYGIPDSVAAMGSHFGLYIAIDHLLPRTYRGHMPKFRLINSVLASYPQ